MKKSNLVENKSLLAKLMATENLTVIHGNVRTASMDLMTRVLRCPVWVDMDGDLYDLLMSHEVGHALYTPLEGWHEALVGTAVKDTQGRIIKVDQTLKYILNVLEDSRIEKKIKRKFPGLKPSYVAAYKDLHFKRNFFGVKDLKSFGKLNLIDRINLHTKIGFAVPIKFNDEEKRFVRLIPRLERFEQVVSLARAIQNYMKQNEQDKIQNQQQLDQQIKEDKQSGKSEYDDEPAEGQQFSKKEEKAADKKDKGAQKQDDQSSKKEKSEKPEKSDRSDKSSKTESKADKSKDAGETDADESDEDSSDGAGEAGDSDEDADGDSDASGGEAEDEGDVDDSDDGSDEQFAFAGEGEGGKNTEDKARPSNQITSVTDKIFREKEGQLIDTAGNSVANVNFPILDPTRFIIPTQALVKRYEAGFETSFGYSEKAQKLVAQFHQKNMPQVAHLVQQFEIWKNSKQYDRATIQKTGDLDTRRLAMYRFTNDIFRRITELPKGKNHGLLKFLDMSGSMNGSYMFHAINQIFILTAFCDRVKIPYDVYGFADNDGAWYSQRFINGRENVKDNKDAIPVGNTSFHLRQLLSSRDDMPTRKRCLQMLAVYAVCNGLGHGIDTDLVRIANASGFNSKTNHEGMGTCGTPLIETILVSRYIIEQFKKSTRTDIVNVIYLTDGDGCGINIPGVSYNSTSSKIIVHDKATHKKRIFNEIGRMQSEMLAFVRDITGCRHIGYYICSKKEVERRAEAASKDKVLSEEHAKSIKYGYAMIPALGFDRYYYISADLFQVNGKLVVSDDATKLTNNFIDIQQRTRYSRLISGQFAKDIADNL